MGALRLQEVRDDVRGEDDGEPRGEFRSQLRGRRTVGRGRRSWPALVAGLCVLLVGTAAAMLLASDRIAELLAPRDAVIEIVAGPEEAGGIPGADRLGEEGSRQVETPPPPGTGEPSLAPVPTPEPTPEEPTPEPPVGAGPTTAAPEADRDDASAAPVDAGPGFDLVAVQQHLRDLRFLIGTVDGVEGPQTRAAVMAFQRVNGIQVDGIIGPQTLGALDAPAGVEVRGGPGTRLEIDLTRQLLHLVEDGERITTMHVSSGNGQPYTTASGGTASANTPVGEFHIERRISGVRTAALGTLYDPLYFYRGWAIHGSNSVPNHPASHGCIRITRADARWLFDRVPDGIPVSIHGGQHVFAPSR